MSTLERQLGKPRFNQPKNTPEIIKPPWQVANELRDRIGFLNGEIQRWERSAENLEGQCRQGRQAACKEAPRAKQWALNNREKREPSRRGT